MNDVKILNLFPEPIFKYKFDNFKEFNTELSKYIYDLYKNDSEKNILKSNQGGWHSPDFEISKKDTVQNKFALLLQKYILNVCQNLGWKTENKQIRIASMWSIINKKGDFNITHTHPNCFLSAAYYVKASKNCGKFQVEGLNQAKKYSYPEVKNKNELNTNIFSLNIEEGDLLIFPGYLPHKVSENKSDEDRIVISFNVDIR